MLTQADFDLLLDRTVDESWLRGLREDATSQAVLAAIQAQFSRVDEAGEHDCAIGLISLAPGGAPGKCFLTMTRQDTTFAATIPTGYRFLSPLGVNLVTTGITTVLAGQAVVTIQLETLRRSELVNTVNDTFQGVGAGTLDMVHPESPVLLDAGLNPVLGPPGTAILAPILAYTSSTPTVLSTSDYLSALGNERGQKRQDGEPTETYRLRVRNIPDVVSPKAIAQAVQGVASLQRLPPVLTLEPFEDGSTPSLDLSLGLGSFGTYYLDTDFFDDPLFEMVARREACAYFRLETIGPPADPDDLRPFYDGLSASFYDDPVFGYADVIDHPTTIAGLMAIIEEADRKRAGGVKFDFYIRALKLLNGVGASAVPGTVWTLIAPPGKVWLYNDGTFSHDPSGPTEGHAIEFTFADATTFTTPTDYGVDSQYIDRSTLNDMAGNLKRITQIRGIVATGGPVVNVVGSINVLEITL